MGCTNERQGFTYNVPTEKNQISDGTGPFVNSNNQDFEKQIELYKNNTWVEKLNSVIEENSERNCLGYRKHKGTVDTFEDTHSYITYRQLSDLANNFARNVKDAGLVTKRKYGFEGEHSIMGIFARNCTDWIITDLACQRDSVTSVTFYNTLGDKAFDHIFEQTECTTICVSNDAIDNLVNYYKQFKFKSLKNVIIYDYTLYADESMFKKIEDVGLKAISFSELIKNKGSKTELVISKPNTLFTLCYTSGTTSLPKGVKLTQNNFFAGFFSISDSNAPLNNESVHVSFLPLAHIMERLCIHLLLGSGGLSCFIAAADVKKYLAEDIALTRPTVLVAVPRVLTLFHQKITAEFSKLTGCKKTMIDRAYAAKKANFESTGTLTHGLYDKLVFSKIRAKFGGRIKYFITGSAPLPMEVANDMKIFFSAPIVEAYGMTEMSGALTVTDFNDTENGMAGGVIRTLQMKLLDRKEMNYHSKTELDGQLSPTGEICCRGLNVFKGYFLDEEKTNEAFDKDGWLKSGDVGRIVGHNKGLKIIDRVKELFKLSQGEYIAPSKLENVYVKNKYIIQLCIYGNSYESYLIAIICPNRVEVKKFLIESGKMKENEDNVEDFYADKDLHAEIKKTFDALAKTNNFNSLEKPLKYLLGKTEFTIQNEMITPTMKLCRNKIENFYKDEINKLYAQK